MSFVDLRSDTVTTPTDEMRAAMAKAEVGDDVYGEDPTVRKLEETAAHMLGKEDALFVASGTMGNLIAVLSHTHPGQEIILEANAHIYYYEVGGLGRIGGLVPRLVETERGSISVEQLRAAIRPQDIHFAPAALFCLENTHNRAGGLVLPQDEVDAVVAAAEEYGLATHLDGARLFNAAQYLGLPVSRLAKPFDSVMVCLSKGLCAPVGSILVGSKEFIAKARKNRKLLGGGMRQAGVLAAAGLVALTKMPSYLGDDHKRAQRLAEGLGNIPGLAIRSEVQTNMVVVEVTRSGWDGDKLVALWKKDGILASTVSQTAIRLVTHYQVGDSDIERVLVSTSEIMSERLAQ